MALALEREKGPRQRVEREREREPQVVGREARLGGALAVRAGTSCDFKVMLREGQSKTVPVRSWGWGHRQRGSEVVATPRC